MGAGDSIADCRTCRQHGNAYLILNEAVRGGGEGCRLLVAYTDGTDAEMGGEPHDVLYGTAGQTEEGLNSLPGDRLGY